MVAISCVIVGTPRVMAMVVVMAMPVVVVVVMARPAGVVGAALRVESRVDGNHSRAEPTQ
jgi:hypothetical protein